MAVISEQDQIGENGQKADQLTTAVVLVWPDRFGGGSADVELKLEQHEKHYDRAGHDREADIA